jgi:uncharacterized protein (TIGR03000 family)
MTMFKRLLMTGGTATFASAALLMTPGLSLAQHHGGGGGGSHAGGGWGGGGSSQRGANGWRGGYGGYGGYGYGGYGSYGWGYPGYYYGASPYYVPGVDATTDYATQQDYYSNEAAPAYTDNAPVPNDRIYGNASTTEDMNTARVNVRVPANAEVIFEGEKTTQTGSSRQFVSPPLTPGGNYTYDIQARWMENGRQVSRTRHVPVQAGQVVRVDFLRRQASDEALEGVAPPHESISTDQGNLPGTTSPDTVVAPGTLRTPGERDNRRGPTNPENAGAPGTTPRTERDNRPGTTSPDGTGTPRTGTTPGDRGNLPGTTPPVGGSNPPPLPPK